MKKARELRFEQEATGVELTSKGAREWDCFASPSRPTHRPWETRPVRTVNCGPWNDWRPEWIKLPYNETVDKIHLKQLLDKAVEESQVWLPHNLSDQTPLMGKLNSRYSNVPLNRVKQIRRFCGWVKVLPEWSLLNPGPNDGAGSPYEPDWWRIFEKHPSPGSLIPWARKAWRVAERVLKPYGLKPMRGGRIGRGLGIVARLLGSLRNPRKAGFIWAAETICFSADGCLFGLTYRQARSLLTDYARLKTSGLTRKTRAQLALGMTHSFVRISPSWKQLIPADLAALKWQHENINGIDTVYCKVGRRHGIDICLWNNEGWLEPLLIRGELTYHLYYYPETITESLKRALAVWKQVRELRRLNAATLSELEAGLQLDGPATVIALFSDSLRAGNCEDGTRAWIEQHSNQHRCALPLIDLINCAYIDYKAQEVVSFISKEILA